MPGYIKESGQQRPVAAPFVKVDGQWRPVALGYIKVDGQWRIWHSAEIVDNFNRADNPTLGEASNGFSTWSELSGSWEIKDNQAFHGSGAGPSIASVQLYRVNTDVTVEVDIPSGTGLGAAFWVQDAQNWWAAIPGRRTQNNPSYYYCADPSYTLNGQQCIKYEFANIIVVSPSSYTGTATSFEQSFACCPSGYTLNAQGNCQREVELSRIETAGTTTYTCPSGYSGPSSTNRCSTPRYKTYGTGTRVIGCIPSDDCVSQPGGTCGSAPGCLSGGGSCYCTVSSTVCTGCGPDFTLSCSNCSGNHIVFATATTSPTTYSCPPTTTRTSGSGSTLRCFTMEYIGANTCSQTVYDCPPASGYTVSRSGDSCTYTAVPPYCPSGYTRNNTPIGQGGECERILYQSAIFVPASVSYPSVIRVQRSIGGVITTQFENDIASDPRSIQVSVTGSNVRVRTYALGQATGTPYASFTYTTSNALKSTFVGIAKNGNQVVSQATAIDNFRAT